MPLAPQPEGDADGGQGVPLHEQSLQEPVLAGDPALLRIPRQGLCEGTRSDSSWSALPCPPVTERLSSARRTTEKRWGPSPGRTPSRCAPCTTWPSTRPSRPSCTSLTPAWCTGHYTMLYPGIVTIELDVNPGMCPGALRTRGSSRRGTGLHPTGDLVVTSS